MNSYEEFLQAIDELYDQNKLDFNNYKLLKKELESMEKIHKEQQTEYRAYFKMLESKIKNLVVSGGGLTENQVQIDGNYKGRIFTRSVKSLKQSNPSTSPWRLLQIDTSVNDVPIPNPGEMN